MSHSGGRPALACRKSYPLRRRFCCSFVAPKSPEWKARKGDIAANFATKQFSSANSFPSSPSPIPKMGLGFIDPRRILSPGRVSPIDSEPSLDPPPEISQDVARVLRESDAKFASGLPEKSVRCAGSSLVVQMEADSMDSMDVRLDLKGKDGGRLVLELESGVLRRNSSFFDAKMAESPRSRPCLIEVGDVADVSAYRETLELMYENDITRKLMKIGVPRSIAVLEVSSTIKFERGIVSCLKYLEAVPWSESEEEKLKTVFTRYSFNKPEVQDILARLNPQESTSRPPMAIHVIQSVTQGADPSATRELKSLVKGLLSQSSVYQKDPAGLTKESLYHVCNSCLSMLIQHFEEASSPVLSGPADVNNARQPLISRISKEVENINWLLDILVDKQMGEDFVSIWARQEDLIRMHERSSPMVRYELSRVSGHVFIAIGKGKLQCRGEERYVVLHAWLSPMLVDFGWLQRCPKGLDVRELEEAMGQAVLTLPLMQQQTLFLEWFACFSKNGTECPDLSGAFQVWWRRSFLRPKKPIL